MSDAEDHVEPVRPIAHPTAQEQGISAGTERLPIYRRVASYPEAGSGTEPTRPVSRPTGWAGGTGQLPVTGTPLTAPRSGRGISRPRGPHLPTVVRGLFVLALVTFVFVWRLVDDPNWAVVGISTGIAAGALLLLAAGVSALLQGRHDEDHFDHVPTWR